MVVADQIRVLIADDHIIVRSGLRLLLDAEPDIDVVGEALDGQEALTLAESLQPDVVLMDITMPGMDGLTATRQLKKMFPDKKVLALTMHRSDEYFFEMLQAGASGYILKGAETDDLIHAIRVVANGEVFLYPTIAGKLVSNYLKRVEDEGEMGVPLSRREKEIVRLIVDGFSNHEISEKLVISPSTVHTHRSNIMKKLELSSRHELIQYARKNGLIN
jgi:two-component system response regulator NreC